MARYIRSKTVHTGRNRETVSYRDDRYVRCARCGFICHLDRDSRSPEGTKTGWGINYTKQNKLSLVDSEGESGFLSLIGGGDLLLVDESAGTVYDPVVTGGCPQCGTYRYNK